MTVEVARNRSVRFEPHPTRDKFKTKTNPKRQKGHVTGLDESKKVILGTKFKRCVQHHELRATDCYFLGGFVQSNLSKPCAIPKLPLYDLLNKIYILKPEVRLGLFVEIFSMLVAPPIGGKI